MIVTKFDSNTLSPDYAATLQGNSTRGLPSARVGFIPRRGRWPLLGPLDRAGREIYLGVSIEGSDPTGALYSQLCQWLDPEDETVKKLTVTDDDGTNERYLEVICEGLAQQDDGIKQIFTATLAVHDDVRWRSESLCTGTMQLNDGGTGAIVNAGTDLAYPTFLLTPGVKTGGLANKAWSPTKWRSANPAYQYPLMATFDTHTPIMAGELQTGCNDLRIYSDGKEADRWLDSPDSAATKVWFNQNFATARTFTLKTAIAASGAITEIDANEDITLFPNTGILLIGTEAFVYTSKDNVRKMFLGVTRGAKRTEEAAHNAAAAGTWIQHDIDLCYGNASLGAPTVDDNYKPCFELDHSTNANWTYEVFGDYGENRAGRWYRTAAIKLRDEVPIGGVSPKQSGSYTATLRTLASPFTVAGMWIAGGEVSYGLLWSLVNPVGITNLAASGQKRRASTDFVAELAYVAQATNYWNSIYAPTSPTGVNLWEAWSYTGPSFEVAKKVSLDLSWYSGDLEVGDAVAELNAAAIPVVGVYTGYSSYEMASVLTNVTRSEAIQVDFEAETGETLEVDTRDKTVIYLKDDSSQFQAVTPDAVRQDWLPLSPGTNVIRFDDTGVTGCTLAYSFTERRY